MYRERERLIEREIHTCHMSYTHVWPPESPRRHGQACRVTTGAPGLENFSSGAAILSWEEVQKLGVDLLTYV